MKITGKIWKTGNSYVITVPKKIVEADIFKEEDTLELELVSIHRKVTSEDLNTKRKSSVRLHNAPLVQSEFTEHYSFSENLAVT